MAITPKQPFFLDEIMYVPSAYRVFSMTLSIYRCPRPQAEA